MARPRSYLEGVLFVVPPLLILGGWARGCRAEERPLVIGIAAVCGVGLIGALIWALTTHALLARGIAYSLDTLAMTALAMLLRVRREDGGSDSAGDPDSLPPEFDWDDFERGFRRELARRTRPRIPA
jgi:hypothetical protein